MQEPQSKNLGNPENINFGIKNNLVKKLLKDNNIAFLKGNKNNTLNKRRQVKTITNSTFTYLAGFLIIILINKSKILFKFKS